MINKKMADVFFLPLRDVNGRNIDTVEIEGASCHYAVMYAKDQAESICRAVNLHDEMVEMIDSLSSELNSMIEAENARLKGLVSCTDLDMPDYIDQESIHDAQVLLAKARGDNNV